VIDIKRKLAMSSSLGEGRRGLKASSSMMNPVTGKANAISKENFGLNLTTETRALTTLSVSAQVAIFAWLLQQCSLEDTVMYIN
jgi:hypothetical protein